MSLIAIGELAELTGVASSTLRSWEQRFGFPEPVRTRGGQRRYRAEDADLVARVVEGRDRGLSLTAAVAAARRSARPESDSLFARLREDHPQLDVLSVGFPVMRSLSYAIEDECLAHATRPVLFGCFQSVAGFERSGERWRGLARVAAAAVAFADFGTTELGEEPVKVALPERSPMLNEWSLVCLDPELSVALVAWEVPGRGRERRFEGLLSLEPPVVLEAAWLLAGVAERAGVAGMAALVDRQAAASGEDPRRTSALLRRFATYADQH